MGTVHSNISMEINCKQQEYPCRHKGNYAALEVSMQSNYYSFTGICQTGKNRKAFEIYQKFKLSNLLIYPFINDTKRLHYF